VTSLPDTLVRFGTELEQAIGREQVVRLRKRHRRRVTTLVVAVVVAIAGTASAFSTVRELVDDFLPQDRVSRTVDGVPFSFDVPRRPTDHWESGPALGPGSKGGSLLLSRSTVGGQRAEAVIFWTGFPNEGVCPGLVRRLECGQAVLCERLLSPNIGRSTGDLAAAMAKAPGTELVAGPSNATVGGRPAKHVVLTVREDVGCDPGYFFTWNAEMSGAFWLMTYVGDKINVWIVDIDGKRLVIEAETRQPDSQGVPLGFQPTPADVLEVEAEIAQIVKSIRFD
jgi:hypothetical protein